MLHYDLEKKKNQPLYETLYEALKQDILKGRLRPGERLPSKREMARDNGVSVKTVLAAYEQLLVEGYLTSKEKKGYFVANVETMEEYHPEPVSYPQLYQEERWFADFTSNNTIYEKFPFSLWRKVMREVLTEKDKELVVRAHFLGVEHLRRAIADYLYRARGITVSPECIVIGAGIEYLYGKLIKLLPAGIVYGVENPGYRKIPRIYEEYGLSWKSVEMDENGISMESLRESKADVIHVSPEHHYPLGTVMSASRRQELLAWAEEKPGRYIIEDDYDCEFRYRSRPILALKSMDRCQRVIYMNTFSKTLAPAIRVSYMVLPEELMRRYIGNANFYSNSASACEQYALAKFIEKGYFERHLSRMKKFYQMEGERLKRILKQAALLPAVSVKGGESGTHLLVKVDTPMTDMEIKEAARKKEINIACLSEFCSEVEPEYEHILVLNYSELDEKTLREAVYRLSGLFVQW